MGLEIVKSYMPGAIGRITELHGTYYQQHAGFGLYFESKVACEFSEFLRRYDSGRDGIWLALSHGRIEGSIVIDGVEADTEGAHLRWFIVSDSLRGNGAGNKLITSALDFCRIRKYNNLYLWTFECPSPWLVAGTRLHVSSLYGISLLSLVQRCGHPLRRKGTQGFVQG